MPLRKLIIKKSMQCVLSGQEKVRKKNSAYREATFAGNKKQILGLFSVNNKKEDEYLSDTPTSTI